MRGSGRRSSLHAATIVGLLAVLALLAVLQNRWLTQLAEAERARLQTRLETAATTFSDDFDRELTRAFQTFRFDAGLGGGELADVLAARLARWRSAALVPELVKDLLVVTRHGPDPVTLSRFDERTGQLVPAEWEEDLASVRSIFSVRGPVSILDEKLPGLIVPVREQRDDSDRRPPRDHVVVRLDRDYIGQRLVPRLAASAFGGRDGLRYSLLVRLADSPGDVIAATGPPVGRGALTPAAIAKPLFSLRFFPELARAEGDIGGSRRPGLPQRREDRRDDPGGDRPAPPRREDDRRGTDPPRDAVAAQPRAGVEQGRWVLEVRHPAGSLEAVVASTRRRNLAISLAIVGLLGTVAVLMMVSTRRAHRLARQQMDFVASVSHELRTPLTAMRSAGQNLADGIVADPERVRSYGALIEREGRRLTEMVSRVLAFAGTTSGQSSYRMQLLEVRELVEGVLADSRWVLEEKRFAVETSFPEVLPAIRGDVAALRQALANLIDNAMKFGADARWIAVSAQTVATSNGEEVVIAVSDRGPGIRRSDLAHLFEPFYRGRDALSDATPGSGLGLSVVKSIVEAHRGRITVDTAPGRGSTFTVHLPAAPPAPAREERR